MSEPTALLTREQMFAELNLLAQKAVNERDRLDALCTLALCKSLDNIALTIEECCVDVLGHQLEQIAEQLEKTRHNLP